MKKLLVSLALLGLAAQPRAEEAGARAWKFLQDLKVPAPGMYRHKLSLAALDAAQPSLADLRLFGPSGGETPYLLEAARAVRLQPETLTGFSSRLEGNKTILTGRAAAAGYIDAVELQTPADSFIKPADVFVSADGKSWTKAASGVPLYRQYYDSENLRAELAAAAGSYVKVVVDDSRAAPVPFTGLRARVVPTRPALTETLAVKIASREDSASSTRLTVKLPAKNLFVFAVKLSVGDRLFSREITVSARSFAAGRVETRRLASATVFSTDAAGAAASMTRIPVYARLDGTDELALEVENGGSPALDVTAAEIEYAPVFALFQARSAGAYRLAYGNRQAKPRSYDLGELSGKLVGKAFPAPQAASPAPNPDYSAPEALPDLEALGAPIDAGAWRYKAAVAPGAPGAQALDLGMAALTLSSRDLRDLRLASGGRQVPYILDRDYKTRELEAKAEKAQGQGNTGLWKIKLPREGFPLERLTAAAPDTVFRRRVSLYETPSDGRGAANRRLLASAVWSSAGGKGSPGSYTLFGQGRVFGDELELEVENGDNSPLELSGFRLHYRASRLLFKWKGGAGLELLYGNDSARSPEYDIELVAAELLAGDQAEARLEGEETEGPGLAGLKLGGPLAKAAFWLALIAVAGVLVFTITRLLPPDPKAGAKGA